MRVNVVEHSLLGHMLAIHDTYYKIIRLVMYGTAYGPYMNRLLTLRSHVIFSAMMEGKQIGCYRKLWLPRGVTKG